MKKTSKRILGIAVVVLLIAVALVSAGAADATEFEPAEAGYDNVSTLCTALNNACSGTAQLTTTTTTDDTVRLLKDVTLKTRSLKITGTVIFDLNGHVLNGNSVGSVITIDTGGNLTLNDSNQSENHTFYEQSNGLWALSPSTGTSHVVYGGCITGGTGNNQRGGGGVINSGKLTMNGGNIVGNTAGCENAGGGVYNSGMFTMNVGSITGNVAEDEDRGIGGGVYIGSGGEFTMNGGSIVCNTSCGNYLGGGGVCNNGGTFTMNDGTISGNNALCGGGVYNRDSGTMTVGGTAKITGNTKGTAANNVYLPSGKTITLGTGTSALTTGASIGVTTGSSSYPVTLTSDSPAASESDVGYFFSDSAASYVVYDQGLLKLVLNNQVAVNTTTKVEYSTVQDAIDGATAGQTVKLIANTQENITVDKQITLDLNGYVLQGTGTGSVITVGSGGNLTLEDSNTGNQKHYFNNAGATIGQPTAGLWIWDPGQNVPADGYAEVTGGCVTGGVFDENYGGGGVTVYSGCTFNMYGGNIVGNAYTHTAYGAGGVYVDGEFAIYGGNVSGNSSSMWGGGVFSIGTFAMNGGNVNDNTAKRNGGGIYCYSSSITMTGGNVVGNNGGEYCNGGGISCKNCTSISIKNTTVSENTAAGAGGISITSCPDVSIEDTIVSGNKGGYNGGGISCEYCTSISIKNTTVTENTVGCNGGGIYCYGATIEVGGTTKITGNTAKHSGDSYVTDNLYLPSGNIITLADGESVLTAGASIGITAEDTSYPVAITGNNNADYSCRFTSDVESLGIENTGSGDTQVVKLVDHTVTRYNVQYDGNGSTSGDVPEDSGQYTENASVTVLGNTGSLEKTGCTFEGWTDNSSGTGTVYNAGDSYTIVTENVTFYAKWVESTVHVTGVTLNKTDMTLTNLGDTETLTATVLPENATDKSVTWTTSDENVATVSSTGVVTGVGVGNATITVTTTDGGKTAVCNVAVGVPVESVSLDKTETKIAVGKTETLTATVLPENATDKSVTWSTSDENVATVDENGLVTAVGNGSATITAKSESNPDAFDTCEVTVYTPTSGSSVTSFSSEKNGNDFTFSNAVVITKMTLPGATYAKVTNTSGSGWYNCNLSTDGTAGIAYFQVPLDVISTKGWTVNDVSLVGSTTTYLKSEGGYAKYSAPVTGSGSYSIAFVKGAATAVVETPVTTTDTQGYLKITSVPAGATIQIEGVDYIGYTPQEKISLNPGIYTVTLSLDGYEDAVKTVIISDDATSTVTADLKQKSGTTATTAAKSPFPVLGILAGLGAAAFFLRRK